jgi:hypothetical protein
MRTLLAIFASISFLSLKAQTHLPISQLDYSQGLFSPRYNQFVYSGALDHKWHLTKYAGLSAGSVFYPGPGNTSFLAVPIGLQLSRPLNKNVYAFAGISATPVFFSTNRLLAYPSMNPSYPVNPFSNGYGFGSNTRVEMGLMYINDAKTFSISGSVGIDRSSYPVYPSTRTNTKKQ